ncbi:MAG: hypothetical protein RMJ44_09335 [Cytophagales bacterium]|nr:hypothetical protein [Bernardetiaceae bacterium]MDW8211277.1 hypothetical protein [Cytophagales bacterium]
MNPSVLRNRIFFIMLVGKVLAILYIFSHWQTQGFSLNEAIGSISLVLPLFTVYTTAMFRSFASAQYDEPVQESRNIRKINAYAYQFICVAYALSLLLVISLKPSGTIGYAAMQSGLAAVESAFGAYLSVIMSSLFKHD